MMAHQQALFSSFEYQLHTHTQQHKIAQLLLGITNMYKPYLNISVYVELVLKSIVGAKETAFCATFRAQITM
jgi:hypothetical protein